MSLETDTSSIGKPHRQPVGQPTQTAPSARRVRTRRHPLVFAVMAVVTAAGALIFAWAYSSASDTRPVLAVAADVHRGEVIDEGDLKVVRVSVDPALTPISATEKASIVGKRAEVDLWAGTLLTDGVVAEKLVPAEGNSLVGISLTAAQMPSEPLYAGDAVRIVTSPGEGSQATSTTPDAVDAAVIGVTRVEETGETVVNVSVPHDNAAELAANAASGNVALVLDSRER
jgi:hypothetical protein